MLRQEEPVQEGEEFYAALRFSGKVDDKVRLEKKDELVALMGGDGLIPGHDNDGCTRFIVAQYNDPSVSPPFRRNEVLIPIAAGFNLWDT